MRLNIHSIDYSGSIVDGPGVRTVIFVQGCDQRCEGCHNPSTWEKSKGTMIDVDEIANELKEKGHNKRVTISGGEPLLQTEAILELIRLLPGFDIAIYTGFDLDAVPHNILENVRYIKVGKYQQSERTTTEPYIGSRNQRFIDLKETPL